MKLSLVVVYMPHGGYPDHEIQSVYGQLSDIVKEGRANKRKLIIGGDWNAEVASNQIGQARA
eukprot:1066357-Karenia_brevis.AAC.1